LGVLVVVYTALAFKYISEFSDF